MFRVQPFIPIEQQQQQQPQQQPQQQQSNMSSLESMHKQALIHALRKGLETVDSLGLDNCTVLTPLHNDLLHGLNPNLIRSTIVNAVIDFTTATSTATSTGTGGMGHTGFRAIQKISLSDRFVLVSGNELLGLTSTDDTATVTQRSFEPNLSTIYDAMQLCPASSGHMALQLLQAVVVSATTTAPTAATTTAMTAAAAAMTAAAVSSSTRSSSAGIELLFCNMSLPCNTMVESLLFHSNGYSCRLGDIAQRSHAASVQQTSNKQKLTLMQMQQQQHYLVLQQQQLTQQQQQQHLKARGVHNRTMSVRGGMPCPPNTPSIPVPPTAQSNQLIAEVIPTARSEHEPATNLILRGLPSGILLTCAYLRRAALSM